MIDWETIRTEYIYKDATMRFLASKYGIETSTIGRRASKEGWVEQRQRVQHEANKEAIKEVHDRRKDMLKTWDNTIFKLYAKAEELIAKCKTTDDLNKLTASMDKLKKLAGIMTEDEQRRFDADIEAKKAQIEALKQNATQDNEITIRISGSDEEWER